MAALMIYDHAITFGQEVEFFWYGPWSLSKVLYLSVRLNLSITCVCSRLRGQIRYLSLTLAVILLTS
ncbi:hypothetical protein EDC04DRAFT_2658330 [Pisolithus marmoratus]|nr:hypothetical protein EDC04DRAFT_2658330 [Pisolithus marmoratus]